MRVLRCGGFGRSHSGAGGGGCELLTAGLGRSHEYVPGGVVVPGGPIDGGELCVRLRAVAS